jgi:asparagine synthase (glutamine-hydrolysing)
MCGLFGYLQTELKLFSGFDTRTLLHHRGPDDTGWLLYNDEQVLLGKDSLPAIPANLCMLHKRLSILDLQAHSAQPMVCAKQRYYLIFNGEIYNHLELKKELVERGFSFQTSSDTEVLLNAYICWGKACLTKLTGMFALVIFDRSARKLFFARDPFGIKPLYYFKSDQKFIFASELKALLPHLQPNINPHRLFHYLRSGLTDFHDETLIAGIKQLPAGHYAELELDLKQTFAPKAFWQPKLQTHELSFRDATNTLREKFLNSIALHLRSDVQVAAALSGGIDSSAIVSSIRYLHPKRDIQTYSYIAADTALTEEHWVDLVSQQTNIVNHKIFADPTELSSNLEELILLQDEPFGSSSIYAQQQVFKRAASHGIKVMLDGQGADELLGGYHFYFAARLASLVKKGQFHKVAQVLWQSRASLKSDTLLRVFYYLLPYKWQLPFHKLIKKSYLPEWLNSSWFTQFNLALEPLKTSYDKNVLQEELVHTLGQSSLPMLLRYADRNSMAYSIESRVPFLTTDLADFILSLPEKYIVSNSGLSKAIFREAMRGIVPQAILNRRDKIGFATPEKNWLLTIKPWVENILHSDYAQSLPVFNHQVLRTEWNQMLAGQKGFDLRYWRWLNFIKWSQLNAVRFNV